MRRLADRLIRRPGGCFLVLVVLPWLVTAGLIYGGVLLLRVLFGA